MNRQVAYVATTMTTSGIQNNHCQLRCSTINPPATMPKPDPMPRIADSRPMLPATFSRGNSSRTIPNESGKMPPATPWMTRAAMSTVSECESAASSVPPARMTSVHTSTRSLPNMSPRRPRIAVPTDADRR